MNELVALGHKKETAAFLSFPNRVSLKAVATCSYLKGEIIFVC